MTKRPGAPLGWSRYYAVVRRIPRGNVTTFGTVALLAGRPRSARHVGYALSALRGAQHDVPWQRVLGKRAGRKAAVPLLDAIGAAVQRKLLEKEGVEFDARQYVSLERFGWPREKAKKKVSPPPAAAAAPARRTPRRR